MLPKKKKRKQKNLFEYFFVWKTILYILTGNNRLGLSCMAIICVI